MNTDTPTMPTWTHKGVQIVLNGSGRFVVQFADGKPAISDSLAAAKARIDERERSGFQPFDAIELGAGGKIVKRYAVSLDRDGSKVVFGTERDYDEGARRPAGSSAKLLPDTPENREALRRYHEADVLYRGEKERLLKARDDLWNGLPWVDANNFSPKK